jgi:hypothetical protein
MRTSHWSLVEFQTGSGRLLEVSSTIEKVMVSQKIESGQLQLKADVLKL